MLYFFTFLNIAYIMSFQFWFVFEGSFSIPRTLEIVFKNCKYFFFVKRRWYLHTGVDPTLHLH